MKEINKYGLLNALLGIINNFDESDSKVIIAKYFLRNFDRIDEINIFDAADECFVTRTSIRRFAKFIGFDNFRTLKSDHEHYNYYKNTEDVTDYPVYLAEQMSKMVLDLSQRIGPEIDTIIEKMIDCNEIVFLASDIYSSRCLEFQKEMILSGKMVRVVSYNFSDNKILGNIHPDSLLVVISISGGFISQIDKFTRNINCRKVIMTSVKDAALLKNYDLVLPVGENDQPAAKTIYHTFAVEYFLDVIHHEYQKRLRKKGT